ncbi:MAG: class I SAM-dependent methyltransferase [Chloroflexi bacterium]|nr:class I SAM-dependent methyltransferase [Chloroflexota bacterium]MCI0578009.1 class I SAM-dependent methyltransferase [Chloroflexota bacterium]MCI0646707.1 class I SAM-dependent methyltransferase [Chloroflexota bacterium]MCI0726108.1 class I SAM-dependent methyltransferase [Chloroflexota bacterium]
MNPKDIVRQGYDKISYNYRDDAGNGMPSDYAGWLAELALRLPAGAPVLDLGCGCGLPVAQLLAERFAVTGVDISPVQIERARTLVPAAHFVCADMSTMAFPAGAFAAIVSFYAIIHLPLEEQPALLERLYGWLRPGGYLMATVGHTAWTGTEEEWLGAPMYWSHTDETTYLAWLTSLGFTVHWTRFIPEGDSGHTLLLAQKPGGKQGDKNE